TAVYIDDISIDSGTSENTNTITGYEVYCNNELLQTIADTATRSFTHNIERGNTYTYYVLNKYDNATSNIGNSVVIDLDDTPTATSEQLRPQTPLLAYPNPTTGAISITAPYNISKSEIIVADITGRKVMSQEINNIAKDETIELSLAALRPGIYIIRLGSQSVKIQKR
ncbi:MAG: T9SS type A sorting domain-containing protein, partial [Bacteroidales bacterium]|nr:T9SS type A sorting domain-containing protein [Bacteroidales bacterium]